MQNAKEKEDRIIEDIRDRTYTREEYAKVLHFGDSIYDTYMKGVSPRRIIEEHEKDGVCLEPSQVYVGTFLVLVT